MQPKTAYTSQLKKYMYMTFVVHMPHCLSQSDCSLGRKCQILEKIPSLLKKCSFAIFATPPPPHQLTISTKILLCDDVIHMRVKAVALPFFL